MNESAPKVKRQVLAKSKPEVTLAQHIDDCLAVYHQLTLCFSRLPFQNVRGFWNLLRDAIVFHDTGKSHPEFQRILYGRSPASTDWNHQRHELFSLYYIHQSSLTEEEKRELYYVVAGHHKSKEEILQLSERTYDVGYAGFNDTEGVLSYKLECEKLWKNKTWKILSHYGICPESTDASTQESPEGFSLLPLLREVYQHPALPDEADYLWNLLLVGMMKQCDHLASAGIKQLYRLSDADFSFLFKYPLYTHQQRSYASHGNVILSSPTGSGKTETALLWLKHQLEVQGEGRVFYVLPYTASINAMYERLNEQLGKEAHWVGMLHGKLAQCLEEKFSDDGRQESSVSGSVQLIQDFKTMVTPLKIVTPFQLLKHIFGVKGFEKGIAEWSGGYFIFDEIHAYDSTTLAQIVVLLEFCVKRLGVTVFIMTATLPTFMRVKLQEALGTSSLIMADASLYDAFDRHRLVIEQGLLSDSIDRIQADLEAGLKVLVVCNTVEQAQMVYRNLYAESQLLIHGSFNAEDRSRKEVRLREEQVQLLVGTQAIEVSLDIDYDTIYTEPAPLDALIQRFGRVNRKRKKEICVCHVFNESNEKDRFIYNQAVVNRTLDVLQKGVLEQCGGLIHERDLQSLIDQVYPCWEEVQKKQYEFIYQALSHGILHGLSPLTYSEQREEEYYKQFDGVKVLPVSLYKRYDDCCREERFVKADSLLVSIRESRLYALLKEGSISQDIFAFETGGSDGARKCSKLYQKRINVIKKRYDSELGLQISEPDFFNDSFL